MRILLGHISTAHGIRGEVLIKPLTEEPADIAAYGSLWDEAGERQFEISAARVTNKGVIARIAGVSDRNAAEALRGTGLYIDRDQLPEPEADEIYHVDMIGMTAARADGSVVGEIVAVQNFGAGDLLEIRLAGKRRTEFVPFNDDFVPDIDFDAGQAVVIMPNETVDQEE
ncbi:MAG: ribosome maturation factor RimM [Hyphomicrobiaceae bacterium]